MATHAGRESRLVAGRYALTDVLGRGGMGVVWLATDQVLERTVALKEVTFPVDLTAEEREVLCQRTMREARAAARLDHPCVTRVYDVVQEDGKPWLVMEHIPSRSLQHIVEAQGPLPPASAARIGLDVLAAIDAAHHAGIVHRDVKPANVLVGDNGHACLTDFGIATTTGDSHLTTQGALVGSPTYMAPERARGDEPRPPVDLWGLGATLYAAVEGRPPFDRGEPMATLYAVVSEHPAPMLRAGPLEPILRTLLDKDPARRGTIASVRGHLEAVAVGVPPAQPVQPGPPPLSAPPPPPPPPAGALRESPVHRFDAEDLRKLASASKAALGAVARDAAREIAGRRRERKGRPPRGQVSEQAPAASPRRRRRFKRRWIVVPVLLTVVLVLLVLGAAAAAVAWWLGGL
jgi:serine/threonine protein kinase